PIPNRSDAVPGSLNWEQWLGVATPRPYIDGWYHPLNWRKRIDFGTATFGDMGCHILDPVFGALGLSAPLTVRSESPAPSQHSWGVNTIVKLLFPGTPQTEGNSLPLTWYDGDARPPAAVRVLVEPAMLPRQGSIFVGTKGAMLLPHIEVP